MGEETRAFSEAFGAATRQADFLAETLEKTSVHAAALEAHMMPGRVERFRHLEQMAKDVRDGLKAIMRS